MSAEREPIDVWFRFESPEDESPSHEANTFIDGDRVRIDHYHTDVGQVSSAYFDTIDLAHAWYKRQGFTDYTT